MTTPPGHSNGWQSAPGTYPPPQQPYGQPPQPQHHHGQLQFGHQQPYGQPPYAPQPFTPMHPASDRSEPQRGKGLMVFLLILSIILTGAFGSVAWILLDPTKSDVEWSLPYYGGEADTQNYLGTWFVGDTVVRAQTDGVSALDTGGGDLRWGLAAPGKGAATICHASSVSSKDIAVLAVGTVNKCDGLFALDLKTGKKLWQHTLPKRDGDPSTAVSAGTVVVNDQTAYDLRSGKKLWEDTKKGVYGGRACDGQGYVGGAQLVRVQICTTRWKYGSPDGQSSAAAAVDPATGKAEWTFAMGDGAWDYGEDATVVSTSPIVVGVPQDVKENGYTVLRDNGKVRSTFVFEPADGSSAGDSSFSQQEAMTEGDPQAALKAIGDTLYIAEQHDGGGLKSAIDAYDLDTGKRLWTTGTHTDVQYSLVQGSGKELLALKHDDSGWREETFGGNGRPAYLVTLDPESGSESQLASYGHLDDALGHSSWAMPYWHDGTLFLASVGITDKAFKGVTNDDQHESALLKMGE
ncbi:PQQ-binding-like beta-propeller repeat protein [Streptomyces sp. cg28]|uniref:outer membrane protein assembly factor BamB family protein n=1 Tax=Streptomyces sp. cg28 TaxID=3403457 RepID=UPI003B2251F0